MCHYRRAGIGTSREKRSSSKPGRRDNPGHSHTIASPHQRPSTHTVPAFHSASPLLHHPVYSPRLHVCTLRDDLSLGIAGIARLRRSYIPWLWPRPHDDSRSRIGRFLARGAHVTGERVTFGVVVERGRGRGQERYILILYYYIILYYIPVRVWALAIRLPLFFHSLYSLIK